MMENIISNDSVCKIALNLNDTKDEQTVIDFRFNKGEDYYSAIYEEFSSKNIPLILLEEISPLMEVLLQEEKATKKFFTKEDKGLFRLSTVSKDIQELWQMKKTRLDEMRLEESEMKLRNDNWKKVMLLRHCNKDDQLIQFESEVLKDLEAYEIRRNEEEMILGSRQEKEMREVNTNDKPSDLVANEHLNQLRQFKYNSRRELAELIINAHDAYASLIDKLFSEYEEILDPNYTKTISNDIKKNAHSALNSNIHLLFKHKLSFNIGSCIRHNIGLYVYSIPDLLENNLKETLSLNQPIESIGIITNKPNTLNKLLSSNSFEDNLFSILNFFTYDINEGMSYLLTNTQMLNKELTSELFFESTINTFLQIENAVIQLEKTPNDYDIITTKHSNLNSFDLMLNVYLSNLRRVTEEDLTKALGNIIYFTNAYCIGTLIIPLDKILEKVYKFNQESEFKAYMKHFKSVLSIIKQSYQTIIKLGVNITTERIVFATLNSFVLAFEKCNSFDGFSFSFNQFFVKG